MDPHHLPSASSLFPVFPFQFSLPFRSLELFQDESSGDDSKIAVTAMSPNISVSEWKQKHFIPIGSMGLVYLPTYGSLFMVNVGKYTNPMDPSWDQRSLTNHPFFFGRRRWGNLAFCFFCRVYHWPCRKSPHQHVSNAAQGPFFFPKMIFQRCIFKSNFYKSIGPVGFHAGTSWLSRNKKHDWMPWMPIKKWEIFVHENFPQS